MQALRQFGGGVVIAIVSIILVVGGISLALAESTPSSAPLASPILPASPTLQLIFPTSTFPPLSTQIVVFTETGTSTLAIASTVTQTTVCTPPNGWVQIVVGVNESIYALAQRYQTDVDTLKNGNCLASYELQSGSLVYVPPIVATAPPIVCGPPSSWVRAYAVQAGDNLYRISLLYRTTVEQLQSANCMGASITIYTGQRLWVPNVPTSTPGVMITLMFPTSTPSYTPIPPTFTVTPMPTKTSTFLPTLTSVPTASPIPPATNTPVPAITTTPSLTAFPNP
ncbi:MAG: LysM peptidoglycan-binding domain-containing protein [Chloroflexota bacterium]